MNMARSMLKGRKFPNEYWAKVVACIVYVINISPTKIVMSRVPEEAYLGMPSNVSHLRVFVCVDYAHVPKEIRGKLDEKSEKYVFNSYSEQSKAYKLYNPVIKRTIINRDVVFKGQESWNGTVDKIVDARVPLMEE